MKRSFRSFWRIQSSWEAPRRLLEATRSFCEALLGVPTQKIQKREAYKKRRFHRVSRTIARSSPCGALRSFLVNEKKSFFPKKLRDGLEKGQRAQEKSGRSEMVAGALGEAQKGSGMVWREPRKLRNGLGEAQKSSEMVFEDPKKLNNRPGEAQTSSGMLFGRSPKKLRNGLA